MYPPRVGFEFVVFLDGGGFGFGSGTGLLLLSVACSFSAVFWWWPVVPLLLENTVVEE